VKIADFGVARLNLSDTPITRVGTNIYAPPEHSPLNFDENGHMTVATLTPAADIYSLAKSVYTLITGEAPRAFANQQITDLPLTWRDKEWSEDFRRVLMRATRPEPSARYQSVDEFWQDLEPVRKIAFDLETSTSVRPTLHETPQPHVSRGYSPLAPQLPRFDTSRELKLKHPFGPKVIETPDPLIADPSIADRGVRIADSPVRRAEVHIGDDRGHPAWDSAARKGATVGRAVGQENVAVELGSEWDGNPQSAIRDPQSTDPKSAIRKRRLRRIATFAILLIIFAGGLYGTSAFLRSRGILPPISNPFASKTGKANTDINLRPEPNANNDPIGLVTKDSKVRILKTQNNWYQVDVLEQGRDRDPPLSTNRGWLNGKYVDLD